MLSKQPSVLWPTTNSCFGSLRFLALEWFAKPRGTARRLFWTRLQAAFYRTILDGSIKFCAHRRLTFVGLAKAAWASKAEITDHLSYMLGLLDLLTWSHHFVPEWAMIFFAALWIPWDRDLEAPFSSWMGWINSSNRTQIKALISCFVSFLTFYVYCTYFT